MSGDGGSSGGRALKVAPRLEGFRAYGPAKHLAPIDLFLAGNEGAALPAEVLAALGEDLVERGPQLMRRYPGAGELERCLGERFGIEAERVFVCAGGDDAILRACQAFLAPGRKMVLPRPSFEMFPRYAQLAGAQVVEVDWPEGEFPLEGMLAAIDQDTAMISVVSPNNPTGAVLSGEQLRALSQAAPQALLLVDLAYAEYGDVDLSEVALSLPNAIVVRTLSKAWGLAGLRIGYVLGPAPVLAELAKAGNPYAVAGPSRVLAITAMQAGQAAVREHVTQVRAERERLVELLRELGVQTQPSQGNFVFARFSGGPAQSRWVDESFAGLGIGVRSYPDVPRLADALRITCPGEAKAYARVEHALRSSLQPEALLFDMDGVLAEVGGSYRQALIETAASYGVEVTPEDINRAKDEGDANNDWVLCQRFLAAAGKELPLETVVERFQTFYLGQEGRPGLCETETLIPLRETIVALCQRIPSGIVTGRPRVEMNAFLDRFELRPYFKAFVCMEDAPPKPDPEPVRLLMKQMGVERAWMIGDTPDDVRAARGAGVVPLGVVPPGVSDPQRRDELARVLGQSGAAKVVASDLNEILERLS